MVSLIVDNVWKQYETRVILRDISFDIKEGEITSILGPSGSGKTTLLKCILGLEKPDRGTITIDSISQQQWLRSQRIAYVPQKYANFEHLTVAGNIAIAIPLESVDKEKRITQILKDVGLEKYADVYPSRLSGGMQQRVALARALAQDTDIIAFDESLSQLDVETRHQMQELILDIWAEKKKTILYITHDIEEAIFLSQRVVVMGTKPGEIREVVSVPFSYPRNSALRFQEQFQKMRRMLSYIIRSETMKSRLSEEESEQRPSITIGLYYWPGNSPFFYAQDKAWFGRCSLPVDLISFHDNTQKIEYWKSGKVDILNVTVDTALRLIDEIPDTEIIASLNISHGGDALISREPMESINEIKGKIVAIEKGEISEFFLKYILAQHGMHLKDVIIQNMKGSEIGSALIGGSVDVAVLWEPWLSKAIELSRAHVISTSNEYPVFADVLIAKKSFVATHGEDIENIQHIWKDAVQVFQEETSDAIRTVAPLVGLSKQELNMQLSTLEFLDGSPSLVDHIAEHIKGIDLR